ncbi:winged helix family transcriptional regulator [Demequina sp. NBRC 110056]|uniref:winged helix family transcriptional regulator n=1 Tax=Demequina sp. NBRC 110056 TaxID=1570345 RepID=UPI000A0262E7|nr:response regulator transcription factor [Demequina sp. NBRC 110056]
MADLLVLTPSRDGAPDVLPALGLLSHRTRVLPPEPSAMLDALDADVVIVDGRHDLAEARNNCKLVHVTGVSVPLLLVLREGGLSIVNADWGADDVVLADASPAEVEARIRLMIGRANAEDPLEKAAEFSSGDLTVDVGGYTARLKGVPLDLTYKEFELLKYLMQHPGRVYTRDQLLQEVWGFDYYGGTRTVDVHVRRLRAKLGAEHEHLIGTVRNVGYRFDPPQPKQPAAERGDKESAR